MGSKRLPSCLLYGETGVGKTILALQAFDPRKVAWCLFEAGALDVADPPYDDGINPWKCHPRDVGHVFECLSMRDPWAQAIKVNAAICRLAREGKISAAILDGGSTYATREHNLLMGNSVKESYAEESRLVGRHVTVLVENIQAAGIPVVLICHEKPYSDLSGRKGGPAFPGQATKDLPAKFSGVFRMQWGTGDDGQSQRMLYADPADQLWYTKDRTRIIRGEQPANLRAWYEKIIERRRQAASK